MRVKIRKTKKKRFRIGKHDDVVGVLLKNKQTQRHIQNQHHTLKQKTIGEIRKYLYDHHLLKIGSNAPPDVLRRMYEDAILTGEVKNTNKDVLLHNFMSGGGGE
jgi:Trm5-related predicted tRNA methylase